MRRILSVVLTIALLVSACGKHSAIVVAELDPQTTAKLDSAINEILTSAAVPGAIVGVWGPKGQYVRTFGVANTATRAPLRPDFYHRIGSVTKTFTVTAVLQLVDEGKVELDDPIAKYVDKVPNGNKITLRELARMQSGLFNYSMSLAFSRDLEADPRRQYSTHELLDYAFAQPSNFVPGQGYEYSNTNAVLLGQVVEKVSGQTLPAFVQEHITGPLGMRHTSFPDTNAIPDPHARGYTQLTPTGSLVDSTDWNPSWASWAGAMISTLDDLRIWVPALATGVLLKPDTQQQRLQTVAMPRYPLWLRHFRRAGLDRSQWQHSGLSDTCHLLASRADHGGGPAQHRCGQATCTAQHTVRHRDHQGDQPGPCLPTGKRDSAAALIRRRAAAPSRARS